MKRQDIINRLLKPKCKTALEFQFDELRVNPLLSYITIQDIYQLNKIATSIKLSSKPKEKYKLIDEILVPRGFIKMASGTNRVVYRFINDYRVVLKVAIDKVGLSDNGNEFTIQHLLKPFVTKCFEVSPCGTVGLFERVIPITSREEFLNLSDDIFDLINNLIGKFVLDDIGEKFYMNYGLRDGFGPVLLDYPYVFELDGRKLICSVIDPLYGPCRGEIDYDTGYNNLICTKCGKRYLATDLRADKQSDNKPKIILGEGDITMKCSLRQGDVIINSSNTGVVSTDTIKSKKQYDKMRVSLTTQQVEKREEKKQYPNFGTDPVTLKASLGYAKPKKNNHKQNNQKDTRNGNNKPYRDNKPNQLSTTDFYVKNNPKHQKVRYIKVRTMTDGSIVNIETDEVVGYDNKYVEQLIDQGQKEDYLNTVQKLEKDIFYKDSRIKELEKQLEDIEGELTQERELLMCREVMIDELQKKLDRKNETNSVDTDTSDKTDFNRNKYTDHHEGLATVGEIVGDIKINLEQDSSYKTGNITSPINNCFAAKSDSDKVNQYKETIEKVVDIQGDIEAAKKLMQLQEESKSESNIPTLIIHPRSGNEEVTRKINELY